MCIRKQSTGMVTECTTHLQQHPQLPLVVLRDVHNHHHDHGHLLQQLLTLQLT